MTGTTPTHPVRAYPAQSASRSTRDSFGFPVGGPLFRAFFDRLGEFGDKTGRSPPRDEGLWRKLRRVLGRIPTGAAVAGVWIGAAAVALSANICWLVALFVALALLTGVATFAPWVPGLRGFLPGYRRAQQLEKIWVEGHKLAYEVVSQGSWPDWKARRNEWDTTAHSWIGRRISAVEAREFERPASWYSHDFPADANNTAHGEARDHVSHQIQVVRRLWEQERQKLR
jgi:hypothetical protein